MTGEQWHTLQWYLRLDSEYQNFLMQASILPCRCANPLRAFLLYHYHFNGRAGVKVPYRVIYFSFLGDAIFENGVTVEKLNNLDLSDLSKKVWFANKDAVITAPMSFTNISVENLYADVSNNITI